MPIERLTLYPTRQKGGDALLRQAFLARLWSAFQGQKQSKTHMSSAHTPAADERVVSSASPPGPP